LFLSVFKERASFDEYVVGLRQWGITGGQVGVEPIEVSSHDLVTGVVRGWEEGDIDVLFIEHRPLVLTSRGLLATDDSQSVVSGKAAIERACELLEPFVYYLGGDKPGQFFTMVGGPDGHELRAITISSRRAAAEDEKRALRTVKGGHQYRVRRRSYRAFIDLLPQLVAKLKIDVVSLDSVPIPLTNIAARKMADGSSNPFTKRWRAMSKMGQARVLRSVEHWLETSLKVARSSDFFQ